MPVNSAAHVPATSGNATAQAATATTANTAGQAPPPTLARATLLAAGSGDEDVGETEEQRQAREAHNAYMRYSRSIRVMTHIVNEI